MDKGFVKLIRVDGDERFIAEAARVSTGSAGTKEADEKLIKYLYRNKHTSPFEMVGFVFHIKCPIFVSRQWMRHRTWSYNEQSQRYREVSPEFFTPDALRKQDSKNKQSSYGEIDDSRWYKDKVDEHGKLCYNLYRELLDAGVAREQARMVLPSSTYTEFYARVDLHNLIGFLKQRRHPHAQEEIRWYAEQLGKYMALYFPTVWGCFVEENGL